ncbi:MAG: hypothetical protein O3C21_16655 [Verrucomicrobia bacterium]|nr:hypothetical protein [Verrucomicrobiota bacterium]
MKIRMELTTADDAGEQDAIRGIRALIKRLWRNHRMKLVTISTEPEPRTQFTHE